MPTYLKNKDGTYSKVGYVKRSGGGYELGTGPGVASTRKGSLAYSRLKTEREEAAATEAAVSQASQENTIKASKGYVDLYEKREAEIMQAQAELGGGGGASVPYSTPYGEGVEYAYYAVRQADEAPSSPVAQRIIRDSGLSDTTRTTREALIKKELGTSEYPSVRGQGAVIRGRERVQTELFNAELYFQNKQPLQTAASVMSAFIGAGQLFAGAVQAGFTGPFIEYSWAAANRGEQLLIEGRIAPTTQEFLFDVQAGVGVASFVVPGLGRYPSPEILRVPRTPVPEMNFAAQRSGTLPFEYSPAVRPYLARFPTGEVIAGRPLIQETLVLRGNTPVRRVTPEEALRLSPLDRVTKLDETRNLLLFRDFSASQRVGPVGVETRSFSTFGGGDVVVTTPTFQKSLLPGPVKTVFGSYEYVIGSDPFSLFDILGFPGRKGQSSITQTIPRGFPRIPLETELVYGPEVNTPGLVGSSVPPITIFLGENRPVIVAPPTIYRASLRVPFDEDVRIFNPAKPSLEPIIEPIVRIEPVVGVTQSSSSLTKSSPRIKDRTREEVVVEQAFETGIRIKSSQVQEQSSVPKVTEISEVLTNRRPFFPSPLAQKPRQKPEYIPEELRLKKPSTPQFNLDGREKELFKIEIGRAGQEFSQTLIGTADDLRRSIQRVRSNPAASVKLTPLNPEAKKFNVETLFGKEFYRNPKTDRYVEKKRFRIDMPEEFSFITGRGAGKNPLRSKDSFNKTLDAVTQGMSLRRARKLFGGGF